VNLHKGMAPQILPQEEEKNKARRVLRRLVEVI
jgi:hypothetical protein